MKDYYSILGVPREAEVDLIKATYLALSKIYHPDVFKGDKKFAQKRMQDINEAFEILSDTNKRKEYDKKTESNSDESSFEDSEFQDEQSSYQNIIKDSWDFAKEYYPFIEDRYKELRKINKKLSWQFQIYILETKSFENANEISGKLKNEWLIKFFGRDVEIQNIALKAISKNQIKIAKEINKAIKILGNIDAHKIKRVLEKKFPKFKFSDYEENEHKYQNSKSYKYSDAKSHNYVSGVYRGYDYIIFSWKFCKITDVPPYHKNSSIGKVFKSKEELFEYVDSIS